MKRSPLRRVSKDPKRRAKRFIPHACLKALKERSGGRCERKYWFGTLDVQCQRKAVDPHHILARSQGGGHSLDNLLHLCRRCHDFCKQFPKLAILDELVIPYKGYTK